MSSNPFQAPQSNADSRYPYRPLRVLSIIVAATFGVQICLFAAMQWSMGFLNNHDPGVFAGEQPIDDTSTLVTIVMFLSSVGYLLLYFIGIVCFYAWLVRANKNARAMGANGMEFTPAWCVLWFFVPLANLFKPYEVVDELYLASDPESDADSWGAAEVPRTILAWWLSWLAFGVSSSIVTAWSEPGSAAAIVPLAIGGLAAALAISVILAIDRRQAQKHQHLAAAPPPPSEAGLTHRFG